MNGKMAPDWRGYYERIKEAFLTDADICAGNRELFKEFFAFEEHKLKRINGLPDLDNGCCKTLIGYVRRMTNANLWFRNKPWRELTREDIQRVYDDLEEGVIKTQKGTILKDRSSYYNKIFKSKPFRLAGKDGLAKDVIEFSTNPHRTVRYVTEESFRRLVSVVRNPLHQLLLWLAWDIGENIQTLLALTKEDFIPQVNRHSGEREYIVHLSAAKLKRSRLTRSEVTLYPETARLLDLVLPSAVLNDGFIFNSGYRSAAKTLAKAVKKSGATTMPHGEHVRWKDLRSGMACHLLRSGWTRDEVNARLGHTPNSDTLNAYINFLAVDREAPKQRLSNRTINGMGRHSQPDQTKIWPTAHQEFSMPIHGSESIAEVELEQLQKEVARLRAILNMRRQAAEYAKGMY